MKIKNVNYGQQKMTKFWVAAKMKKNPSLLNCLNKKENLR